MISDWLNLEARILAKCLEQRALIAYGVMLSHAIRRPLSLSENMISEVNLNLLLKFLINQYQLYKLSTLPSS